MIAYLIENPAVAQEIRLTLVETAKAECQAGPPPLVLPPVTGANGANGHAQA